MEYVIPQNQFASTPCAQLPSILNYEAQESKLCHIPWLSWVPAKVALDLQVLE